MRLILYNSLLIRINSSPLYIDPSWHGIHFIYIPQKPAKTGTSCPRLYPLQTIPSRLACPPASAYACACPPFALCLRLRLRLRLLAAPPCCKSSYRHTPSPDRPPPPPPV